MRTGKKISTSTNNKGKLFPLLGKTKEFSNFYGRTLKKVSLTSLTPPVPSIEAMTR